MKKDNDIINTENPTASEQEIDLLELGLRLWTSRKRLLVWGIWGAIIGLIIAISIPREYTSTVKLVPESGDARSGSGINTLASLAGINFGGATGSGDAINPSLYPDVVSSNAFVVELFDVKLPINNYSDSLTLSEIIREETSSPWWSYILAFPSKTIGGVRKLFSSNSDAFSLSDTVNPFHLSPDQEGLAAAIKNRVTAGIGGKYSVVTITVMLQDPLAAACLADTVATKLQEYIVSYRTGKARKDLEYSRKINDEARDAYYEAQRNYANYVDRNQGIVSQTASIEKERLQNEAALKYNLYNSTSQQVQLAEAKVQSNTPVFAVVEPASVPNKPSKPRKIMIIIGFIFLAIIAASAYTLFAPGIVSSVRNKKKEMHKTNQENS